MCCIQKNYAQIRMEVERNYNYISVTNYTHEYINNYTNQPH